MEVRLSYDITLCRAVYERYPIQRGHMVYVSSNIACLSPFFVAQCIERMYECMNQSMNK